MVSLQSRKENIIIEALDPQDNCSLRCKILPFLFLTGFLYEYPFILPYDTSAKGSSYIIMDSYVSWRPLNGRGINVQDS
jgi:hypothetical protein